MGGFSAPPGQAKYILLPASGAKTCLLGDSIGIGDSTYPQMLPTPSVCTKDLLAWSVLMSDGRLIYTRNAGLPGNTSAQALARFDTDITPYTPAIVILQIGTNDEFVTGSLSQELLNVSIIIQKTLNIGALPVLCGVPPRGAGFPNLDVLGEAFNDGLRSLAMAYQIPFADFRTSLIDYTTGHYLALYNFDGVHPSSAGAIAMAQAIVNAIAPWLSTAYPLVADTNIANTSNGILANPLFLGAPVGGVAPLWNGVGAGSTPSVAAGAAPVLGNWQVLTALAANTGYNIYQNLPNAAWAPGDRLKIACRMAWDNPLHSFAVAASGQMSLLVSDATVSVLTPTLDNYTQDGTTASLDTHAPPGKQFTVEYDIPQGATSLDLYLGRTVGAVVGGSVQFAQVQVWNKSRIGLA